MPVLVSSVVIWFILVVIWNSMASSVVNMESRGNMVLSMVILVCLGCYGSSGVLHWFNRWLYWFPWWFIVSSCYTGFVSGNTGFLGGYTGFLGVILVFWMLLSVFWVLAWVF